MNSAATPSVVEASSRCSGVPYRCAFAVAGIGVEVTGSTPASVDLGAQLQPFLTESDACEIQVRVEWKSTLDSCAGKELFHSGCVWNVCELGDRYVFDFSTGRFGSRPYKRLVVDRDFRRATVLLNRQCMAADDASRALEYPLDELLVTHRLSLAGGVELHACGLVDAQGNSFLFSGHSGAGKSTTARLWTRHLPVHVLSDDRIIVREHNRQFFMHGTPWHGEAAFALPGNAPIRRVFLLEHGTSNRIERISRSVTAGELLARSFTPFYAARFVEPVLALLEALAESVPCYRFQFIPDASAVEKILGFRD